MFILGQKVICINDRFHPGIHEWGDQLPRLGGVYTIRQFVICRDRFGLPGPALKFAELSNPDDRLAFSEWRFKPYDEAETERAEADVFEPAPENQPLAPSLVGQTFLSAGAGDFPVASAQHRTGKSGKPAGWKACPTRIEPAPGWSVEIVPRSVDCLRAVATANEPITIDHEYTLQPGQLLAELSLMRSIPAHWPSLAVADALRACGLLGGVERMIFLHLERRPRFRGSWLIRLHRFSANVLAHADAAGLNSGRGQAS